MFFLNKIFFRRDNEVLNIKFWSFENFLKNAKFLFCRPVFNKNFDFFYFIAKIIVVKKAFFFFFKDLYNFFFFFKMYNQDLIQQHSKMYWINNMWAQHHIIHLDKQSKVSSNLTDWWFPVPALIGQAKVSSFFVLLFI